MSWHIWLAGQVLWGGRPQPAMHTPTGPLHTRPELMLPHSESPSMSEQPHRPRSVRHSGLGKLQRLALPTEHSVQAPASGPVLLHAGRAGSVQLGAPSVAHGEQTLMGEQNGVGPAQSAFDRQPTQRLVPSSHNGVGATQRLRLAALHSPQAPLGRQTGVAPPHSLSARQGRQVFAVSHTGVVPEQ